MTRRLLLAMCVAVAARADQAAIDQHLAEFNAAWSAPVSAESPYSMQRVQPLLNLDHPGLETVKSAAAKNDFAAAGEALLAYFRATRSAPPTRSLSDKDALHAADALERRFRGNRDAHPPVYRGVDIDWLGPAFVDGKEIHDREWYFQFQRLTWWPALAKAYAATGDERYFHELRYEMVDWAAKNLPITKETPWAVRRGMETYNRCERLTEIFPYLLSSPEFDVKALGWFLGSFHQQAEHIRTVYAKKGNHLLGELSVVFVNGVRFPEFRLAEAWKNDALERLPRMMSEEIYADGMNKELVFSYHTMYISLFASAYSLFKEHGYEDRLPADYYPRLLRMARIYAAQAFPNWTVCQFGDAWKFRDPGHVFRRSLAPFRDDLPYYDFMASNGSEGEPPSWTNASYPESGFWFFRSGWDTNAVFMPIKNGVGDIWHSQIDNGTFELYAYGRDFMTDSGSYMYGSSSKEDQYWRDWFRSTKAHQTLTLDRRDIDLKPSMKLWDAREKLATLVLENQSHTNLTHRRTVCFVDDRYFLILDEAEGAATGATRAHFQWSACDLEVRGDAVETLYASGANLLVRSFPVDGRRAEIEREEGWISYQPQRKQERPAFAFRIDKDDERPTRFLTALIPYRENQRPKTVFAKTTAGGLRLRVDAREYEISIDVNAGTSRLKIKDL